MSEGRKTCGQCRERIDGRCSVPIPVAIDLMLRAYIMAIPLDTGWQMMEQYRRVSEDQDASLCKYHAIR